MKKQDKKKDINITKVTSNGGSNKFQTKYLRSYRETLIQGYGAKGPSHYHHTGPSCPQRVLPSTALPLLV